MHITARTQEVRLRYDEARVVKGLFYPEMPPMIGLEPHDEYSNRLLGVHGDEYMPYDHKVHLFHRVSDLRRWLKKEAS